MTNLDAGLILDLSWTPYVHARSRSHMTGSALAESPNPSWHFDLLKMTLRVEKSKMKNSLQQTTFFLNGPKSKWFNSTSSTYNAILNPYFDMEICLSMFIHAYPVQRYVTHPNIGTS